MGKRQLLGKADAEALLAAQSSIGFGMQSLNIEDPVTSPLGVYPTSRQDWVANFQKYPNAPVHHLQLNAPGSVYWWPGYPIGGTNGPPSASGIVVSGNTGTGGTATVYCADSLGNAVDCSPLSGEYVYVSGNDLLSLNGIWMVTCSPCASNTVQFNSPANVSNGTYYDGKLWSPNYWPITMPFALQHSASSLEVWECDLDFAFGQQTTDWVSSEPGTGCPEWGLTAGSDTTYPNAIHNTLIVQPAVTSVHSDRLTNSWHF